MINRKLLKLARAKKRYYDAYPEVGVDFFIYDDCIKEAADDLGITVDAATAALIKSKLIYDEKHPRLMRPRAGFDR